MIPKTLRTQCFILQRTQVYNFSTTTPFNGKSGTKFTEKQVNKLIDPMGFLTEEEKHNYSGLGKDSTAASLKEVLKDKEEAKPNLTSPNIKPHIKEMKEEFGFKAKGPEPTRYGDWEKKGRVSDF